MEIKTRTNTLSLLLLAAIFVAGTCVFMLRRTDLRAAPALAPPVEHQSNAPLASSAENPSSPVPIPSAATPGAASANPGTAAESGRQPLTGDLRRQRHLDAIASKLASPGDPEAGR